MDKKTDPHHWTGQRVTNYTTQRNCCHIKKMVPDICLDRDHIDEEKIEIQRLFILVIDKLFILVIFSTMILLKKYSRVIITIFLA